MFIQMNGPIIQISYDYLPSDVVLASETGTLCSGAYGPGLNQDNTSSIYNSGLYASENDKIIFKSLGILIDGEYRNTYLMKGLSLTNPMYPLSTITLLTRISIVIIFV